MKTNLNPTCCWLSPLFLAACGLLWTSPAPAHDDDPGRRPTFFSRLFHGGHKHKAPPPVTVEEPQVVERVTTVTYPDGRVERYVNTPPPATKSTVREEVPAMTAPSYSMRSVRERPVTPVTEGAHNPDSGLRLPDGYVAVPAPRPARSSSPEATPAISSRVDSRPAPTPQAQTKRTREVKSEDGVVASSGNNVARDPETPRPKQRTATVEKPSKPAAKTRSDATPARDLTAAAPANFLEESSPSTAIGTVQKKFEHSAPSPAAKPSKEDATPPEKMLIGGKGQAPADLPPEKKMEAPKSKDPAPVGKNYPIAARAEKPGFLKSPYEPFNELDATGLTSGSLARDPTTGKIFRVP